MEYTLREYTDKEYRADLKKLLEEKGLHDAVKDYCDKMMSLARTSKVPRKIPGNARTLLIWLGKSLTSHIEVFRNICVPS